jgi:hypothetical protein
MADLKECCMELSLASHLEKPELKMYQMLKTHYYDPDTKQQS